MAAIGTQKQIRQRAPLLFLGLLAGCFGLMAFDAHDPITKQRKIRVWAQTLVYPLQKWTSSFGSSGVGFFQRLGQLRAAQRENDYLKEQLAQKEAELQQARLAASENARLKELLDIRQSVSYPTVTASVIGRDPNLWFQTVMIDVGANDGVEVNMPVMAGGGLLGRVIVAGPVSSQVMLLTDDKSAAGAVIGQVADSGATGTVKGLGKRDALFMDYVSGLVNVTEGATVVTTGQDKIYPPGLVIGTIEQITRGTATSSHQIYLRPAAKMYALTDVAVALYKPQQRTEAAAPKTAATPTNTPGTGAVKVFGTPSPSPAPAQ
jgi:rod shape-determining protein MreC